MKKETTLFLLAILFMLFISCNGKTHRVEQGERAFYYWKNNEYMTHHGNSWMMRRYYWSSSQDETGLPDDDEYFNCRYAGQYYIKAKEVSKNKKFAALCLRMAARCEDYRRESNNFTQNKYCKQIKKEYPGYYDDLVSNLRII